MASSWVFAPVNRRRVACPNVARKRVVDKSRTNGQFPQRRHAVSEPSAAQHRAGQRAAASGAVAARRGIGTAPVRAARGGARPESASSRGSSGGGGNGGGARPESARCSHCAGRRAAGPRLRVGLFNASAGSAGLDGRTEKLFVSTTTNCTATAKMICCTSFCTIWRGITAEQLRTSQTLFVHAVFANLAYWWSSVVRVSLSIAKNVPPCSMSASPLLRRKTRPLKYVTASVMGTVFKSALVLFNPWEESHVGFSSVPAAYRADCWQTTRIGRCRKARESPIGGWRNSIGSSTCTVVVGLMAAPSDAVLAPSRATGFGAGAHRAGRRAAQVGVGCSAGTEPGDQLRCRRSPRWAGARPGIGSGCGGGTGPARGGARPASARSPRRAARGRHRP